MPTSLRLLGAAAAAGAALAATQCFAPPNDAVCLSWRVDADNISFTGVWPSFPSTPSPVGIKWGAWGIS